MIRHRNSMSAFALALVAAVTGLGQETPRRPTPSAGTLKKPLDHASYDLWKRIESRALSPDGKWVFYQVRAAGRDANAVLTIQATGGETKYVIARGESARFTDDSRFAAYLIKPDRKTVREGQRGRGAAGRSGAGRGAGRGRGTPARGAGPGGSEGDAPDKDAPKDDLEVLELSTGTRTRISRVKSFQVPAEAGGWIAWLLEKPAEPKKEEAAPETKSEGEKPSVEPAQPAQGASEQKPATPAAGEKKDDKEPKKKDPGTELFVRDLNTGAEFRFADVVSYEFSENGRYLVYTTSSTKPEHDGVFVVTPGSGAARQIIAGRGHYKSLVVDKSASRVAFLTDRDDYDAEQPSWSIYQWTAGGAEAIQVAAEDSPGIPDDWWISDRRGPSFSEQGNRLFFATTRKSDAEPDEKDADDEPKVTLDVWHWQDPYLQPMQLIQREREANRNYLAVAHLDDGGRIVQLADETVPEIQLGRDGDADVALGTSNLPYRLRVSWDSPGYDDVYVVDVRTGEHKRVLTEVQASVRLSPGAQYLYWWDGQAKAWMVMPADGEKAVNVTELVPHPVHDPLHDTPQIPRGFGAAGWLQDDKGLVIYDAHDLWMVDPAGFFPPTCITDGVGRELNLRFRYERLDRDEDALDPAKSMILSAFHERDKSSGYYRDTPRGTAPPEKLVMVDQRLSSLTKADDAETMMFTREKFDVFPDLWVTDSTFQQIERVSEANPQQSDYLWGTSEIVEWTSSDGQNLQGVLCKPEGFDPGRKYPMIVYFYERLSDSLHQYTSPAGSRSSINRSFYVSRNYLVFMPDIPYATGRPGQSAVNAVVPGVLSLINRGFVDPERIGVQGHSWGGYQIAYMVTKTDLFACAESGAPVSNMTSAYGGIRWSSGMSRMFQYERTQSRIGGTLWEAQQKYLENSPIFWADSINTPLLILHNDKDGAVPWYQGIELFVALRRLGKPAWMLNYNGEDHGLAQPQHRDDFAIRMQQFFDHYLKGAPPPVWLANGIPAVDKGKTLGLELVGGEPPDRHERLRRQKSERDEKFRTLSAGVMAVRKITYNSRVDQLEIPAYVFEPLEPKGDKAHAALVWIHGGVHGDLDPEHYYPFLKEAVERGYFVVCPEYRGSTGYGKAHYDAIDYGGYEVDDCLSAVDYIKSDLPHVDPARLGMIGWSHGGFITLHGMFREPETFKCGAALVPVTNLVFRLSYKGPGYQQQFSTQERIGGLPHEKRATYIERSPVYHVDKLRIPLLVHVADNDRDVDFVEAEQLINALLVKKPLLVETKVYNDPDGGHTFNRRVNHQSGEYTRDDTPDQIDSWNRIWAFLERNLGGSG